MERKRSRRSAWPLLVVWLLAGAIVSFWLQSTYSDKGDATKPLGHVTATVDQSSVTLEGVVPTEQDRTDAEDRAAALVHGGAPVLNNLVVDDAYADGSWLTRFGEALSALPDNPRPVTIAVAGGAITVSGEATGAAQKSAVITAVHAAVEPDLRVIDRMTIAKTQAPTAGAAAALQAKLDSELKGATIEFATGSAKLTPRGKAVLDKVLPTIKSVPALGLSVRAHTDADGDAAANLTLSRARATTVVNYLVAHGVTAGRLTAVGLGETQPIASNATDAGRQKNRRVELRVKRGT